MDERHTFQLTVGPEGVDISNLDQFATYRGPREELIGEPDAAARLRAEGEDPAEFRIINADLSDWQA